MNQEEEQKLVEIKYRLSDAFPPTSTSNFTYTAKCHQQLQVYGVDKIKSSDITYRPIKYKADIVQIKQLHEEWFPINYSQEYYDSVFKNSSSTLVAELTITHQSGRKENLIVGAMTYRTKSLKSSMMQYSLKNEWNSGFGVYIMTLGVVNELRGQGIALHMLQHLKDKIQYNVDAKYIYLDMVTYNNVAAKFYEKNDFIRLKTKHQHYSIEEKQYDAYVYVWYKDEMKRNNVRQKQQRSRFFKVASICQYQILLVPLKGLRYLRNSIYSLFHISN